MNNTIGRVQLPARLSPLIVAKKAPKNWEQDGKAIRATMRKFGESYEVAQGLVKDLQGNVTLVSHRLAEVAFLQLYSPLVAGDVRTNLFRELRLTEWDLQGYTSEQISIYVHQFYADACEACMTEVLMDRRKYVPGDPARFDKALAAISALASGGSRPLDPSDFLDGEGKHIRKGETTVNVTAINAVVAALLSETLNRALKHYPITDALVGRLSGGKTVSLAQAIDGMGMDRVLDVVMKREVEAYVALPDPRKPKDVAVYRCVRGTQRPVWRDGIHSYMQEAIHAANEGEEGPFHDLYVRVGQSGIEVTVLGPALPTVVVKGLGLVNGLVLRAPMPDLREMEAADHEVGGFHVSVKGEARSFARHCLLCINRNAGAQIASGTSVSDAILDGDIRLVTVMDVLAHAAVDHLDDLNREVARLLTRGIPITESLTKRFSRDFRTMLQTRLQKYVRPIGQDRHDDGVIYDAVDMLPLQVSVEQIEALPEAAMAIKEHVLKIVDGYAYPDPLRPGVSHEFSVGAAPKGGSFAHVTKTHGDTGRTLIELSGQPGQHNTIRGQREALGLATTWPVLKTRNIIRTIWDGLMPELMTRATDLVFAYVPSDGVTTNGRGKNGDAIDITPDGLDATAYVPKHAQYGPMTPEVAEAKAKTLTGDSTATVETLVRLGWDVRKVYRFQGFLDAGDTQQALNAQYGAASPKVNFGQGKEMLDMYTELLVLVSADPLPTPKGRKIGWCGTKSVGAPLTQRRYIVVGGKRVYIDVIATIETMEQKKLQGDVVTGQGALLGKTHFDGTERPQDIEDHLEDLKDVASPKNGSIVYREADGKATKYVQFPLYDEAGNNVGMCIPALHRSFVMKENETLAHTQKENGMSRSPWAVNMFGGDVKLRQDVKTGMEMLAGLIAEGAALKASLME